MIRWRELPIEALRFSLELLAIIAFCEVVVMVLLSWLVPAVTGWQAALLDASLLTCLAAPLAVVRARTLFLKARDPAADGLSGEPGGSAGVGQEWRLPVLTLVLGLMVSWFAAWGFWTSEHDASRARFDRAATQIQSAIEARFDKVQQGFHGLRSAMTMMDRELRPHEFSDWMQARFQDGELLGIRGIGFIKRVPRGELEAWQAAQRAMGIPDFEVKTKGGSADLYVISRIEPLRDNRQAWGYDVGSEAFRRQAAEEAVRTGQVTLTRRITLVQDGLKRPGFLFYMPLFRKGVILQTVQDRRDNLVGLIYAPIVMEEFLRGIAPELQGALDFGVYDSPLTDGRSLLAGDLISSGLSEEHVFTRHVVMTVGGQPLTLAVGATRAFDTSYGRSGPVWVGVLGSILSAALALMVWLLRSGRERAEAMANAMTHDLKQAKRSAEAALREQATILATLERFSIVCVASPDGIIREVNDLFCQLSGYDRDQLIGQNPRMLSSGKHDAMFWIDFWQTLLHGSPWMGPICNRARSGQLYWVQTVIAPVCGPDGAVEKYISFGYDITESRTIQDDMAASAERYNLAIDGGNDGLWDWMNVHSHEEWWSPQFFRLLGYAPNEIAADLVTFDQMLHPDQQQATFAAMEAALRDFQPFDVEYQLRTKSGQYRWFRSRAKVYFDEFGQATRMAGSIQDIHERKMAQAQLQEHMEQMSAIFSLSPDGFVSFDTSGKVSYVSPAFTALTGIAEQTVLELDEVAFGAALFRQAEGGQAVASIDDVRHHAGRVVLEMKPPARRMLEFRLSRGQGQAVAQVLALRDVTHETEVDQMKSAFLSMAAHELRTPMASIYGFTELLLTRELKPEKQKDLLGRIYRQSEAMAAIINELLDLARIEARQGKDFTFQAHNLSDLVAGVIQDFKTPEGRQIPSVSWPDEAPQVWVDAKKMQQAVLNILSNAYKYSPQGGAVEVSFDSRVWEGRLQCGVAVRDHGIGLSAEQLARVGERFYRADKSGAIPGTGLGVSIVKEILELMGGSLSITSEQGQGSCVTLWVPQLDLSKVEATQHTLSGEL